MRLAPRLAMLAALAWLAPAAWAQGGVEFHLSANQTRVSVGEPFTVTLSVSTSDRSLQLRPTTPDFGELTLRGGPSSRKQTSIVNGRASYGVMFSWSLAAPREGTFTIGPSTLAVGGQTLQTETVTIKATKMAPSENLPESLRKENIISARSGDVTLDQILEGRLFLRPAISDRTPFVSEPVIVSYDLYRDPQVQVTGYGRGDLTVQGALTEVISHPDVIRYQTTNLDGRTYQVAPRLTAAIVPTAAGELVIEGYEMAAEVLPPEGRRGRGGDPFGLFNDPLFGFTKGVSIPSPPISLQVRELPQAGQPPNFTGTVGTYSISAYLDRTQATTGDFVTLIVTLQGRGAIELAGPPRLPEGLAFDQVELETRVEKQNTQSSIGGSKTFEFVLRPLEAGALEIPPLEYPIFDPDREEYRTLRTEALSVAVTGGRASATPNLASGPAGGVTGAPPLETQLRYIKTEFRPTVARPSALLATPWVWLIEGAGVAFLAGMWTRRRRKDREDPRATRRRRALPAFERRLAAIKDETRGDTDPRETAGRLEAAARACIADRFDCSAEGLTRQSIEELLRDAAVDSATIEAICENLDRCAAVRYAPTTPSGANLRTWADEMAANLKKAMAQA